MAIPFAAIAKEVVGMDVAETMLSEAERNCRERGCDNVTLVLSDDSLSQAAGLFDLVHSCLVLQHVEMARGRTLFKALVDKIKRLSQVAVASSSCHSHGTRMRKHSGLPRAARIICRQNGAGTRCYRGSCGEMRLLHCRRAFSPSIPRCK